MALKRFTAPALGLTSSETADCSKPSLKYAQVGVVAMALVELKIPKPVVNIT